MNVYSLSLLILVLVTSALAQEEPGAGQTSEAVAEVTDGDDVSGGEGGGEGERPGLAGAGIETSDEDLPDAARQVVETYQEEARAAEQEYEEAVARLAEVRDVKLERALENGASRLERLKVMETRRGNLEGAIAIARVKEQLDQIEVSPDPEGTDPEEETDGGDVITWLPSGEYDVSWQGGRTDSFTVRDDSLRHRNWTFRLRQIGDTLVAEPTDQTMRFWYQFRESEGTIYAKRWYNVDDTTGPPQDVGTAVRREE